MSRMLTLQRRLVNTMVAFCDRPGPVTCRIVCLMEMINSCFNACTMADIDHTWTLGFYTL